jgi:hypothetical protein
MIEVEIQGFQSISKVSLRLDGFTALGGRSNLGKSAIVRALKSALTGASGTSFVRHASDCERLVKGVKKCRCQSSVRVKLPELTFLWEKGDYVNQYTVWKGSDEPVVYSKVDRGTPEFLLPQFAAVKVGEKQEMIQVSDQWNPIFLLNQGGNTVADVLSDVAQLNQINVAMGLVGKDRKNVLSTRKVREKDVLECARQLERYEGLDKVVKRASSIEQRYEAIEGAQNRLAKLEAYLATSGNLSSTIDRLEAAVSPSVPRVENLKEVSSRAVKLGLYFKQVAAKAAIVRRYKGVGDVSVPEVEVLRGSLTSAVKTDGWLDRLKQIKLVMGRVKGVDKLPDLTSPPLEDLRKQALTLRSLLVKQARLVEGLARLEGVDKIAEPDIPDLRALQVKATTTQGLLTRGIKLQANLKALNVAVSAEMVKLELEDQEILNELGKIDVCPTCAQPLDAKHCLHVED